MQHSWLALAQELVSGLDSNMGHGQVMVLRQQHLLESVATK